MGLKLKICVGLMVAGLGFAAQAEPPASLKKHAISMHGDIKYGAEFTHFDYANPDAPKGGTLRLSALGSTFDTFNPFSLKGNKVEGAGLPYETLSIQSDDEPFTGYGLLAETIEVPADRSWVSYELRKTARWQDGKPVTPQDVVFSFHTLMEKGHPRYRFYYGDVAKVEITGPRSVKFTFKNNENRELALIMGQMPILPQHYWADKDFQKTTLTPPLGSGPYKVKSFEAGRNVVYTRIKDYWGENLAVNAGRYNFDEIQFDYYRDATVAIEAFKGGAFDYRYENIAKNWATAYDIKEVHDGLIKKLRIEHEVGTGMQGFVFNLRRTKFQDPKVRQALAYGFDFDWANKNLFHNEYSRTNSYWSNSELASRGLPQGAELALLEKYRGKIPEAVFTTQYKAPKTDGSGKIRSNLKQAVGLLKEAGWKIQKGKLVHVKTGEPMRFEILLVSPAWERIVLPFKKNLARLGIDVSVRMVDSAQYKQRTDTFDYDIIVDVFSQSQSPGNEQLNYWTSAAAQRQGSRNSAGIQNPVIDELVDLVISAPSRKDLVLRTRALDRVLLWNHFVIPNWHLKVARIVSWDRFGMPQTYPKYNPGYAAWEYWWLDGTKDSALRDKRAK